MKIRSDTSSNFRRHETCFTTGTASDKNKIKYLKDKITCKLSPNSRKKGDAAPRIKVTKTVDAKPAVKSRITSTLTTSKDPKTLSSRIKSRTNIAAKGDVFPGQCCSLKTTTGTTRKVCKTCSTSTLRKPTSKVESTAKDTGKQNTFGVQKRKIDLVLPKLRNDKLVKSPDLVSPTEVKKAVLKQLGSESPTPTIYKSTKSLFSSVRNGSKKEDSKERYLPIKVAFTEHGKRILQNSHFRSYRSLPSTPIASRALAVKSVTTSPKVVQKKQHTSFESNKLRSSSTNINSSRESIADTKKLKKFKKDQLNGEIAKKSKKQSKPKEKPEVDKKCAGRAAGTEIVKQLRKMEEEERKSSEISNITEIERQRQAVQSDSFFQHLLLRDIDSPLPRPSNTNPWITERTMLLQRKRSSFSEPSIGAVRIYLQHTKPVTDSKFRSLDASLMRSRSVSPSIRKIPEERHYIPIHQTSEKKRSISLPPKLVFSQTSRPVTTVVRKSTVEGSPPHAIYRSPSGPKSPSSDKSQSDGLVRSSSYITRSSSSIDSLDRQEYQWYIKELMHSSRVCKKFKELNQFYSTLERMGQLERSTSTKELRPRRRNEDEIIDYDRWKEIRSREKAEQELQLLYRQLKTKQKEAGFIFRSKDIENIKWRREFDRGLRIKERSVEDIKGEFEKLKIQETDLESAKRKALNYQKDTYKPLWRGNSVLNLATSLVERRSLSEGRAPTVRQKLIDTERLLTHGIGSRIWSSLSMEQVNILKHQLTEIYGQNFPKQLNNDDCSIDVSLDERDRYKVPLTVRRNSDSSERTFNRVHQKPTGRFDSGALSENDKKRLSQSLSKEVLDRVSKQQKYKTSLSLVLGKETRGAIAAAEANVKTTGGEAESPRTCYSLEMSEDGQHEKDKKNKDDFVLVLAKNDSRKSVIKDTLKEWAQPKKPLVSVDATTPVKMPSTSETESGSTDDSNRTVVFVGKSDDVQKKVEYFEQAAKTDTYTPTIYRPAESSYDIGDTSIVSYKSDSSSENLSGKLSSSQSCQSLKELFGEKELVRYATVPLSATRKHAYVPPSKPVLRASTMSPIRTVTPSTSNDSIYRSRSLSPYFGESYALVRSGEVRRLKNRFESPDRPTRYLERPRRWKSDPQLNQKSQITIPGQTAGDVDSLRRRYEYPSIAGRGRSRIRRGGVVSPVFLRAEDRFMPHINIISKIASLYPKRSVASALFDRRRGVEELAKILGCPVGEVERLRQKFDSSDNISLLGHMFTSSPNIKELRDIAPYLAAEWAAHRYPRLEDNTRSLSSPEQSVASRDLSLVRRTTKRPKSASPTRSKKSPSSILKTHHRDVFGGQYFDPKSHRPVGRYQPPAPRVEPVKFRSWWPPTPTHIRPSVTFKGVVLFT